MPETNDENLASEKFKLEYDLRVAKFDLRIEKETEEYEKAKEKLVQKGLDYSDEEIRMLSASIKTGAMGVIGENKDLARVIKLRRKIDKMSLKHPDFKYGVDKIKGQLTSLFPSGDIALKILGDLPRERSRKNAANLIEANKNYLTETEKKILELALAKKSHYRRPLKIARDLMMYQDILQKFPGELDLLWEICANHGVYPLEAFRQDPDFFDNNLSRLSEYSTILSLTAEARHWKESVKETLTLGAIHHDELDVRPFIPDKTKHAMDVVKTIAGKDIDKIKMLDGIGYYTHETYEMIAKLKPLYGEDAEKLEKVVEAFKETMMSEGIRGSSQQLIIRCIDSSSAFFGNSIDNFKNFLYFLRIISSHGWRGYDSPEIQQRTNQYYRDPKKRELFFEFHEYSKYFEFDLLDEFIARSMKHGKENGQRYLEMVNEFNRTMGAYDKKVLAKFVQISEQEGVEAGRKWLSGIREDAKKLLDSGTPDEIRKKEEYKYVVQQVFPKGNYSNHDKNLACGDRLEHLGGYEFDKAGYATEMSGLVGYRLRTMTDDEGRETKSKENPALLGEYQQRIDRMRSFIASRGPDNKALQEAFVEKVNAMFDEKAEPAMKAIKGLSVEGKMLALFVGEVARKIRSKAEAGATRGRGKEYVPNA